MNDPITPFKFSTTFKVRWVEVDIQQVVFFGHYLTYADEALMEYLRLFNFGFKDIWAQGLDWVYANAHVTYKGSAQFEDMLSVHVRLARIGNSSMTAELQIFKQPANELIVTIALAFVVVDRSTRKPVRVPDEFRQAVDKYQE